MSEQGRDATTNVAVEMSIRTDRTVIEVTGQRDLAVVVRSEKGEEIYLPPADFEDRPHPEPSSQTPYRATEGQGRAAEVSTDSTQTPYQSADSRSRSPYDGSPATIASGLESTPAGLRIVHPEPVDDLQILR